MLKDITLPTSYTYTSKNEFDPFRFHLECLMNSTSLDLLLGYFSSSAIRLLSIGFASFIHRNGKIRLAINNILSEKDRSVFEKGKGSNVPADLIDLTNLKQLKESFSEYNTHFFECLAWLIANEKIEFVIISPKEGKGISHYKEGVYSDGVDKIAFSGSQNFTAYGLTENLETLECFPSWIIGNESRVEEKAKRISDTIELKRTDVLNYLNIDEIKTEITSNFGDKEFEELLVNEKKLFEKIQNISKSYVYEEVSSIINEQIEEYELTPRFPYKEGPREYQMQAYQNWVENDYKGLFAMATGTGKTLTSAYCLIEEFKKTSIQKNIIVVPGIELINQWSDELKQANFNTIIKWASNNSKINSDINYIKVLMHDPGLQALNIIITYDSFVSDKFLNIFKNKLKDFIVVFDETHNMGASGFKSKLSQLVINKTIGLSATPLRLWDENNENEFIESFFNTSPPYTYSYSMEEAIRNGFLCKYHYEPFFVNFNDQEWEEYKKLTLQLHHKEEGETINTKAALKRQLLKDQADNKNEAVLEIIKILYDKDSFKNTLIYCPKGIDKEIDDRYIYILQDEINDIYPHINTATFLGETKGRDLLLKDFENEDVHMLLAIKCLDEGVNIPKTMNAIFIASGQNYREFVQRRGRVLRNYKTDNFKKEYADIFDIVVLPTINQFYNDRSIAERLIISEFKRLYEFYNLSSDKLNTYNKIKTELAKYGLTEGYINTMVKNGITN